MLGLDLPAALLLEAAVAVRLRRKQQVLPEVVLVPPVLAAVAPLQAQEVVQCRHLQGALAVEKPLQGLVVALLRVQEMVRLYLLEVKVAARSPQGRVVVRYLLG